MNQELQNYQRLNPVSPNSNKIKELKKTLPDKQEKGLFDRAIGQIQGDVSIQWNKDKTEARQKMEYGEVNKDYAFHVHNLFNDYCISTPFSTKQKSRKQERINHQGNKVTTWCFQTITHKCFADQASIFIPQGKKQVPAGTIEKYQTEQGQAHWYMDDGCKADLHSYRQEQNTQGFDIVEVETMAKEQSEKFDQECKQILRKDKPVIVQSGKSYKKFYNQVSEHIIAEMRRKQPRNGEMRK